MELPMRPELMTGNRFPDFELPDYTGEKRKLSGLLGAMPGILAFTRGYF